MAIEKRDPNTIILAGKPPVTTDIPAGGILLPGYLLSLANAGDDTPEYVAHASADAAVHGMILMLENGELNKGVDDACADGEVIKAAHLRSGDQAWVLVASAENVAIGSQLQSNGDGKFKVKSGGVALCFATEVSAPQAGHKRVRVEVLVYRIQELPNAVMSRLARQGSVAQYRAATPMPKEPGEQIDSAVVKVGRSRLVLVDAALNAGLGVPMPNWVATMILTSHRLGEAGHAKRGMLPGVGERQKAQYEPFSIPIYVTWEDFGFNARELAAAEENGTPLDTSHAEQAVRNDNVAIEDALINGAISVSGMTTPGLLDVATPRQYVGNEAWTASGHTGEEITQDLLNAIGDLQSMGYYGPFDVAMPTAEGNKTAEDYKAAVSGTIDARIRAIPGIGNVRTADLLPANKVLVYQPTSDVFDIIVGQMPAVVSYPADASGWATEYMALACVVPRVKTNILGDSGVVVLTTT